MLLLHDNVVCIIGSLMCLGAYEKLQHLKFELGGL